MLVYVCSLIVDFFVKCLLEELVGKSNCILSQSLVLLDYTMSM